MANDITPALQRQCTKCRRTFPATCEFFFARKQEFHNTCKECEGHKFGIHARRVKKTPKGGFKFCVNCERELPATLEYFGGTDITKSGLQSYCRDCKRHRGNQWRVDNLDSARKSSRNSMRRRIRPADFEDHFANVEQQIKLRTAVAQRGYKICPTCEKVLPATLEYFILSTKYRDGLHYRCRDCHNLATAEHYQSNPLKKRLAESRWRKNNPLKNAAKSHRYRARKISAEGSFTNADIELQYRSQNGKCWHCGKKLDGDFQVDHLIPLSRGGTNWPNNLVCSCSHCNQSKHDKFTWEWNGKLF